MLTVLEGLKERLESARSRLSAAQQAQQAAQVELNAAVTEYNVWNSATVLETQKEAIKAAQAQTDQIPIPLPLSEPSRQDAQESTEEESHAEPISKTELVREKLRAHPMGLTTGDLWKALREPISNRAYLYSILKRLRDKEEIVRKRGGKYVLRTRPAEVRQENESPLIQ